MTACDDEAMSESDKAALEALSTRSRDALRLRCASLLRLCTGLGINALSVRCMQLTLRRCGQASTSMYLHSSRRDSPMDLAGSARISR